MDIHEVSVPLSFMESYFYRKNLFYIRDIVETPTARLDWTQNRRQKSALFFPECFKILRFNCMRPYMLPYPYAMSIPHIIQVSDLIQFLFESKRLGGNYCLSRLGPHDDHIESISRCRHIFCDGCYIVSGFDIERGVECPICHGTIDVKRGGLWSINSKCTWVVKKIQQHFEEEAGSLAKIVVLSSSIENLCLLKHALTGLAVESVMCSRFEDMNMSFIEDFIHSSTKVLLMTIDALQFEIKLPSHSHVIVTEAVVLDVEMHIFLNLTTMVFDNSLSRYVLFAPGTIEELIYNEPRFPDRYNSFDEHNRFLGPVFTDLERIVSLLDRLFAMEVEAEEEEEDENEDEDEDEEGGEEEDEDEEGGDGGGGGGGII